MPCDSLRWLELLYALASIRYRDINIALGVHRERMTVIELPDLMTGPAETSQNLAGGVVENVNSLVPATRAKARAYAARAFTR